VDFDRLDLDEGETSSVLAKSDSGAFSFELYNPSGASPTVLRFGVRVGGSYIYGTYPAASIDSADSHFLIGAYDGDGGVRIWVDGNQGTAGSASGGVTQNNVDVLLGADPQGPSGTRFFFQGKIQQALVQNWTAH
jgi:hypothetical protein